MDNRNANSMTVPEAFAAYSRGERLACPVCQALLISIPEVLSPGTSPVVLKCPNDNRHFFVHGEPAGAMKAMRERMKEIAAEDKIKGT